MVDTVGCGAARATKPNPRTSAVTEKIGQTQETRQADRPLVPVVSQSPVRWGRLRRCSCCNSGHRNRPCVFGYNVTVGCGIYGRYPFWKLKEAREHLERLRQDQPEAEIVRERQFDGGGSYYEVIRDGKWVNEWEGRYGKHTPADREARE